MNKVISDIHGNRKRISNVRDGINVLSISNKKNISDRPDSVNSIISVPRNKFLIPDTKKKTDKPVEKVALADKPIEKIKSEKVDKNKSLAGKTVEKVKPVKKIDKENKEQLNNDEV